MTQDAKKVALRLSSEVFHAVSELAARDRRSINAEIAVLLREALELREPQAPVCT